MSRMTDKYECIINLQPPSSEKHPPMDRLSRATQFAPFAALTGYEDVIAETGRHTDSRIYLSDDEKLSINDAIKDLVGKGISLVCFVPDERKDGGSYEKAEGTLRRIDPASGVLVLDDGRRIRIDDIVSAKKSCRG